jgi:hypothetical protein
VSSAILLTPYVNGAPCSDCGGEFPTTELHAVKTASGGNAPVCWPCRERQIEDTMATAWTVTCDSCRSVCLWESAYVDRVDDTVYCPACQTDAERTERRAA